MLFFFLALTLFTILAQLRFRLMVLCFPFFFLSYLYSTEVAGIPVNFLEGASWVLFVLWVIQYVRGKQERLGVFQKIKQVWGRFLAPRVDSFWLSYWPGIVLLVLGVLLSFVVIPVEVQFHRGMAAGPEYEVFSTMRIALGILKGWIIAPLLYFWVLVKTVKNRDDLQVVLYSFVGSALLLSVVSMGEFGLGLMDRLKGPFESPNYLAMYIAPAFLYSVIMLVRSWQQRSWQYVVLLGMGCLLLGVTLLATKTYASWIATFVALLWSCYYLFAPRTRVLVYGLLLVVALGGVAVLSPSEKFQRFFDAEGDSSTAVRVEVYDIALGLALEHPVTGIGPGQFEALYKTEGPRLLGHLPKEWVMLHPHNTYLAFWLSAGVLGLLGYLWLLGVFFYKTSRNMLQYWPLVGMMLIILVHGLFDTYFWKNDLIYLFWMILGISTIMPRFRFLGMRRKANPAKV